LGELFGADLDSHCVGWLLTRVLNVVQRKMLVGRTLETEDQDALRFLTKVKARADK
jgi:hypothetical protein